eukprot:GHVN01068853.1.p1 GENE.GHVN01068853.1~~GHVN01068853.1.p1  ORF type:complete len:226 (-),score=34.37 GHVN01068853.1:697-1374(-)
MEELTSEVSQSESSQLQSATETLVTEKTCRTATFGPAHLNAERGGHEMSDNGHKGLEARFIDTLKRLQTASLDNAEPPVPPPPPAVLTFEPPPDAVKIGVDEAQLRLVFGNMLSDMVLELNESPAIPDKLPINLVLKRPNPIPLTEFEKSHIKEMHRFLKAKGVRLYGTVFEDGRFMLRYLQGNKWDYEKTLEDMQRHMAWRGDNLPIRYASVASLMVRQGDGHC